MGVSIDQYRTFIGMFNFLKYALCGGLLHRESLWYFLIFHTILLFRVSRPYIRYVWRYLLYFKEYILDHLTFLSVYAMLILLKSWDIETNPGLVSTEQKSFSIYHWNLNSVCVDNFTKLALIEAYLSVNKFYLVCLCDNVLRFTHFR